MKTAIDWIDEAKKKSGSDYRTAKEIGVTRQAISLIRTGRGMTNETARKLAEYMGVNPLEIIASIEAEKHPESAKKWQKWVAAAAIMACVGITGMSIESMDYSVLSMAPFIHYAIISGLGILIIITLWRSKTRKLRA